MRTCRSLLLTHRSSSSSLPSPPPVRLWLACGGVTEVLSYDASNPPPPLEVQQVLSCLDYLFRAHLPPPLSSSNLIWLLLDISWSALLSNPPLRLTQMCCHDPWIS